MKRSDEIERIYVLYPKKVAPKKARDAISKALTKVSADVLLDAVTEYARACAKTGLGREFIPYPATWFNQERWDDDRTEWWRGSNGAKKSVADNNADAFREVCGE